MSSLNNEPSSYDDRQSMAELVRSGMRFFRMLRHRLVYLNVALVVTTLLGAIYYTTATRIYQATASLLITQASPDFWNMPASADAGRQGFIPTYEQLFSSDIILRGAVKRLQGIPLTGVDFRSLSPRQRLATLRRNLTAQALRRTNIITLTYRAPDPKTAETIIFAIVESYLEFVEENHRNDSSEMVSILHEESQRVEKTLAERQQHLLNLRKRVRDFGITEGSQIVHPEVQRVLELNETVTEVWKERLELQASLSSVREAVRNGKDLRQHLVQLEPLVGNRLVSDTLGLNPQFTENLHRLEQQLIQNRAELDSLLDFLGPTHPRVERLQHEIHLAESHYNQFHSTLASRLNATRTQQLGPILISMLEEKLTRTWDHEKRLRTEYDTVQVAALKLNDDMASLSLAARDVERLGKQQETLLDRIADIDISQQRADVRVSVVSEPSSSSIPVSPKPLFVVIACALIGLGGGCGAIYIVDLLDDRFRSPEEIKDQLDAPLLALVRDFEVETGGLQVDVAPDSIESEAFRTLRTAITFAEDDTHCLVVTSSAPGDGKTTVLANLGAAMAQSGKRTLLIDADMRRPGLTRLFERRGATGLSNLLRDEKAVPSLAREWIQSTHISELDFLPCGHRPSDHAELLSDMRLSELIGWAEANYDQVLVDCPPVMAASDAVIIGRLTHGAILVVQPAKNHRHHVIRAGENLVDLGVKLIGVVANRVGPNNFGFYGYDYAYDYGYDYGTDVASADDGDVNTEGDPSLDNHNSKSPTASRVTPRRAA